MPSESRKRRAPEDAGPGGSGVLGGPYPNPNLILKEPRCKELPLQEGELLVVGQVRSPAMRALELQVALRWHAQVYSKPRPKGWAPWQLLLQPGGADDLAQDPLCSLYLSNIADLLGLKDITDKDLEGWFGKPRQAGNKKQRVAAGREALLGRLPKDPPCSGVEPFIVPPDDLRVPLRGKEGIRAMAEGIKAGAIIGPYRGYCLLEADYDALLESPPDWLVARYQGDVAVALRRWKLWLESYAAEEAHEEVDGCMAKFIFSGFGYGNETCLANDPHIDPPTNKAEEEDPQRSATVPWLDGLLHGVNAQLYVFHLLGWPYTFLVATKDIPPGQEVLYKYGTGYWQTVMPAWTHYSDANRAYRNAKMVQLKELQLQQKEAQQKQLQEVNQSLLDQCKSLQQQLAAAASAAVTVSQSAGATTVQQTGMQAGVPAAGAAAGGGRGGTGRAGAGSGPAAEASDMPSVQPQQQQLQQAAPVPDGEASTGHAATATEGEGECDGPLPTTASGTDGHGSDDEVEQRSARWALSPDQVRDMEQRQQQRKEQRMRAALARLSVTDRGATVNPQQKAMASVADFTAVEALISELTDVLTPFQGGLKRQKLGVRMPQRVKDMYDTLYNFLLAHKSRFCMRGDVVSLTPEYREELRGHSDVQEPAPQAWRQGGGANRPGRRPCRQEGPWQQQQQQQQFAHAPPWRLPPPHHHHHQQQQWPRQQGYGQAPAAVGGNVGPGNNGAYHPQPSPPQVQHMQQPQQPWQRQQHPDYAQRQGRQQQQQQVGHMAPQVGRRPGGARGMDSDSGEEDGAW